MMEPRLQILLFLISLAFTGFIFLQVRKETLELKYSLSWCLMGLILVILALKPALVEFIAKLFGIGLPVNAVFLLGIFCILIILLTTTIAVSRTSIRTKRLAQEVAILKLELSRKKNPD